MSKLKLSTRERAVTIKVIQKALELVKYLDQLEEVQGRKKGVRKYVRKKR